MPVSDRQPHDDDAGIAPVIFLLCGAERSTARNETPWLYNHSIPRLLTSRTVQVQGADEAAGHHLPMMSTVRKAARHGTAGGQATQVAPLRLYACALLQSPILDWDRM